ncbi:hypothetical protein AURDEDRAFT_119236 [Auricularia subglabra TFB-10046 SS5]|nr:hypothetical protein AURDEDRAFT_119236 [Auricularia subglabra TFB-10046 SS5]
MDALCLDAPSSIHKFPPEILVECAGWLNGDSQDRIHASQVSKLWRETLLAAPTLWTTIDIRQLSHPAAVDYLDTMLKRCAPLNVHLLVGLAGAGETALIEANIARFGALTLGWRLEPEVLLWTLRWPSLRCLKMQLGIVQFPEGWGGNHMPVLETFALRSFMLPQTLVPLTTLHTFHARMGLSDGEMSDARALFTLCPNLASLTLAEVWDPEYLPQGPPPKSLRDISLVSAYGQSIDLSGYLSHWIGSSIRSLTLQSSVLAVPIQLFTNAHANAWKLTASTQDGCPEALEAEELDTPGTDKCHLRIEASLDTMAPLSIAAALEAQCARLTALSIGGFPLFQLLQANLTLPALAELTHCDTVTYVWSNMRVALDSEPRVSITAPALKHLEFVLTAAPELDEAVEPQVERPAEESAQLTVAHLRPYISTCIVYGSQKLESLTAIGHSEETLRSAGVHALTELATAIYGRHTPSDEKVLLHSVINRAAYWSSR